MKAGDKLFPFLMWLVLILLSDGRSWSDFARLGLGLGHLGLIRGAAALFKSGVYRGRGVSIIWRVTSPPHTPLHGGVRIRD